MNLFLAGIDISFILIKLNIPHKTVHNRLNSVNLKYSNYIYKDKSKIPIRKLRIWSAKKKV